MDKTDVTWAGSVAPGAISNPVYIKTDPLTAAMIAELLKIPAIIKAAKEYPKAYAGVKNFGRQIELAMFNDSIVNPAHFDVRPQPRPSGQEMERAIREGIDRVPTEDNTRLHQGLLNSERTSEKPVQYNRGRARVFGSRGLYFDGDGFAVND